MVMLVTRCLEIKALIIVLLTVSLAGVPIIKINGKFRIIILDIQNDILISYNSRYTGVFQSDVNSKV